MRLLAFATACFISSALSAQITITSADMPEADESYPMAQGALINDFDFSITGEGYTWDYSDLEVASADTTNLVDVDDAPLFYQFLFNSPFDPEHEADFAVASDDVSIADMVTMEDIFLFYQNNEEDYRIVGTGVTVNSIPIPAVTEPVDVLYNFPLNYMDSDSSYSEWMIEIPETATYKLKQTRTHTVDGYGTLITPEGEYEVLRVRMDIDAVDSVAIDLLGLDFETPRSSVEYHWLALDGGLPILQVTESLGFTSSIVFQYSDDSKPTGVVEWSARDLVLYPNPAKDYIWVDMPQSMRTSTTGVKLLDIQGKEVRTYNANAIESGFDLSGLNSGRYTLLFVNGEQVLSDHAIVID